MTAQEIDEMAKRNSPMPEKMTQSEQILFKSLRLTYESFRRGLIDKRQGAKEKTEAINCFERMKLQERAYSECSKRAAEIGVLLAEANKNGCEICRKIADIFTGIVRRANDKQE